MELRSLGRQRTFLLRGLGALFDQRPRLGHKVAGLLAADVALDEARVIEEMRAHLAGYKIPRMYFTLPELPRNGTGKIDRAALRNLSSDQDGLASNEDSAYARQAV